MFLDVLFQRIDLFFLIFGRVAGFFFTAIPFNSKSFLIQAKIWLAAFAAYLVFMVYPGGVTVISGDLLGYLLQFCGEVLIGAMLGFLTQIAFCIFQLAGQMIDMQIGFGVVSVVDPQYGIQVPVIGNFKNLLAMLFFLAINGHHYLLAALNRSYQLLPVGDIHIPTSFYAFIFSVTGEMFSAAFKVALPILGAVFIADLALGIIARTVPQMNVFIVGLPLKIGIGLGMMLVLLPLLIWVFNWVFTGLFEDLNKLLIILGR